MLSNEQSARRGVLTRFGQPTLSAAALGLLGGTRNAHAQSSLSMEADVGILNVALGMAHEAIHAYQLGAGSGLLQKAVLDAAMSFQSHHKAHRDALPATIQSMGGKSVAEKPLDEHDRVLNAATLDSQTDVLMLAALLEPGATHADLGVIPALEDDKLGPVAARLAADETMHWTALSQVLGKMLPAGALSFGA